MKHGLLASPAFFALAIAFVAWPAFSADSAADSQTAEAAARKADGEWAATASTRSIDAWMSFYAPDAVVLLPNNPLASGRELVRSTVAHFLALPHLSVAWRPIEVKAASPGGLAYMMGAYEQRFDGPLGGPINGRREEIWRKQADGTWKCAVDIWGLDTPAVGSPAAPASLQGASPSPRSEEQLVQTEPATQAEPLQAGPLAPAPEAATKYGDKPAHYEEAIRKYFSEHLKHPESVQYREITQPEQGYITEVTGGLLMREKDQYGWMVKVMIDARDSHDRYTGVKTYRFLFRAEKIVDARLPLPGDEMK